MNILKGIKTNAIFMALCFIALGVILAAWPTLALDVLCVILGIALFLTGVVWLIGYFRDKSSAAGLAGGIFMIVCSVILISRPGIVQAAVPLILAVAVLADSITKLQTAIEMKRAGYASWWQGLVGAIIMTIAAVIIICDPISLSAFIMTFIGVAFIVNGAIDLWGTLFLARGFRKFLDGKK